MAPPLIPRKTGGAYDSSCSRRPASSLLVPCSTGQQGSAPSTPSTPRTSRTSSPPSSASSVQRPSLRPHVVIVVEGINDARNVAKHLDVDVYVLGSATKTSTSETQSELLSLKRKYKRIVLLLDPDVAGRQARNEIDVLLQGENCWHAFVPSILATLGKKTKYKDVGDVGVEHAGGEAVRRAVLMSRPSRRGRGNGNGNVTEEVFGRRGLVERGLVAEMGVRGGDVTRRRELVCAWLGIGMCDGKQLLRQLNVYGFTEEDLEEGLRYAAYVLECSLN